jgi:hypothetical protein
MDMLDAEILSDSRTLSDATLAIAFAFGFFLWLFGWRWHRFWVVMAVTVAGGLAGLRTGQLVGGHVLAFGILLAVVSGLLALELARLLTFAAGAFLAFLLGDTLFPAGQERWLISLGGGLLAIILYRLVAMVGSAACGTALMIYTHAAYRTRDVEDLTLWLSDHRQQYQLIAMSVCISGLLIQAWLERRSRKKQQSPPESSKEVREPAETPVAKTAPKPRK